MRSIRYFLLVVAGAASSPVFSQIKLPADLSIMLRRSSAAELSGKPARISYTNPSDGPSSSTVDAAAGLDYAIPGPSYLGFVGLTAETHKNTAIGKEQNKSLAGAASRFTIYLDDDRNSVMPQLIIADEHDVRNRSRGLLTKANLRGVWKRIKMGQVIGRDTDLPLWYEPSIGYQRSDVRKATIGRGHVNRVTGSLDVAAFPLGYSAERGWRLSHTVMYWGDFAESSNLDDGRDRHYYRLTSLAYQINENVSLALSRISGENVLEGLASQKYIQLAVEIKL